MPDDLQTATPDEGGNYSELMDDIDKAIAEAEKDLRASPRRKSLTAP
ncbi:MAG TPA: hypothetical protein VGR13_03440 [Actinomycetota bacterium]|nr:hypothetical protein [Actinomycetota bacterium]